MYSVRELKLDTDGILKCMKLMKQEERQKTGRYICILLYSVIKFILYFLIFNYLLRNGIAAKIG